MQQAQGPIVSFQDATIEKNDKYLLYKINMNIPTNSIFALFGFNGAGKSSLAYSLMGLPQYALTSGRILFDNEDITSLSISERAKKGITLAWQEPAKFEGLSVKTYLRVSAGNRLCDLSKCLEDVGLAPNVYLDRIVDNTLSGGERKRIELASVMAMAPRVAILDEPDSGVDVANISTIKDSLRSMKYYGSTVVIITHQKEIAELADEAALICGSTIEGQGSVKQILGLFEQKCTACFRRKYEQ